MRVSFIYISFSRPKTKEELFNLRHAQARNVVERIFGILKRRFAVFSRAPEYPIETQTRLIPAISALHNFLRIHDRTDEAHDLGSNNTLHREGSGSISSFVTEDIAEQEEIAPEELGMQISEAEKARASARRDRIAQQMWDDYVAYTAEHGGD